MGAADSGWDMERREDRCWSHEGMTSTCPSHTPFGMSEQRGRRMNGSVMVDGAGELRVVGPRSNGGRTTRGLVVRRPIVGIVYQVIGLLDGDEPVEAAGNRDVRMVSTGLAAVRHCNVRRERIQRGAQ